MNTLEFLRAVLPEEGTYYLAIFEPDVGYPYHKPYSSLERMADAIEWYETNRPEVQVYHACSAYKEEYVEINGKKVYRKQPNWLSAKAFWLDLDCGPTKAMPDENGVIKGYATKKEAAIALKNFVIEVGLPSPMVINSGNGLHIYWPLSSSIPPEKWIPIANGLMHLLDYYEVIADHSRTADFSSILRPVGSYHKKAEPKLVKCELIGETVSPKHFYEVIRNKVAELGLTLTVSKKSASSEADDNDDLTSHIIDIPKSAEIIAENCQQVRQMRDTQGNVSYAHWWNCIGIIKHCVEGEELAHKWSSGHPDYSEADTASKYESWEKGPTTCQRFSLDNPKGCEGCIHAGKITTPMQLGKIEVVKEAETVEAIVDGIQMQVEIPQFPKNYTHSNGFMVRQMKDKDGITHEFVFSPNVFYPTGRIRKEDGKYSMAMRMHLPDGRTREFELDTRLLASPQKLTEALTDYELTTTNNKDAAMHLTAYMRDYLEKLKSEAQEMNTMTTYGWTKDFDGFLLGDRLYHRDGTVRKVFVGKDAKKFATAFPVKGDALAYGRALGFLYNRPGMEPIQYAIASVFGSVLTPFADSQYNGLMLCLSGGTTAKGKTTACNCALYAFGIAPDMTISGKDGGTMNARFGMMAAFNNVPILMDELTHMTPADVSTFAYQLSMGKEKLRMRGGSDGVGFADIKSFRLAMLATSNEALHGKLASLQANSQAEAVRLIEISIDQYPGTKLPADEIEGPRRIIEMNIGSAGDMFLKHIMANLEESIMRVSSWSGRLLNDVPESKFRFYRWHAACSLAALEVTNKLEITNFNIEKLYAFILDLFKQLDVSITEQNTLSPEDALHSLITELAPRTIVSQEYRDGRDARGPEQITFSSNAIPAARYIEGNSTTNKDEKVAGKIFICRKEFVEWCKDKRMEPQSVIDYAKSIGVYVEYTGKFTLGRGTRISTGNTSVVVFDRHKLNEMAKNAPTLTIHTSSANGHTKAANN